MSAEEAERREEVERLQREEEERLGSIEESQPQTDIFVCKVCGIDYEGVASLCGVTRCIAHQNLTECMYCGVDIPEEKQCCGDWFCHSDTVCSVEGCEEVVHLIERSEECEMHRRGKEGKIVIS